MATIRLDLARLNGIADDKAERGLKTTLAQGEAIMKAVILSQPGEGRVYGKHRASAPGQPPAPDTGELRNKTNADPSLRRVGGDLIGRIVANSRKASALENGTERMAARPFLSRLVKEHAPALVAAFKVGAK